MERIKFYTNDSKYLGQCKGIRQHYLEIKSWLYSGNYIVCNCERIVNEKQFRVYLKYIKFWQN